MRDGAVRIKRKSGVEVSRRLEAEWQRLSARHLPVTEADSVWRMSRHATPDDPEQGWKIHVSATVLSANAILKRVALFLHRHGILFKAPLSLEELSRINCGLYYGFSQVGKFITVYPRHPEEARFVADNLHRLTHKLAGPMIPFDLPFRRHSPVHYRFGSFAPLDIEQVDGTRVPAIRQPDGELEPDSRESKRAYPAWTTDPLEDKRRRRKSRTPDTSPLKTTIRAYHVLSQRGKGGVYLALDVGVRPARRCVLKEGRRHGETDWDGRDGSWRVRHEARVLSALSLAGVKVPEVYRTFKVENHFYLVTEYIEGVNLQSLLNGKRRKITLVPALQYGYEIAKLLGEIHATGWVWRDCKPLNLIVAANDRLRPVDFEGACKIGSREQAPLGTPGYLPPEWHESRSSKSKIPEDLYALGATLHQLITGRLPDEKGATRAVGKLRRGVPLPVRNIINALLDADPQARPAARMVEKVFALALKEVGAKRKGSSASKA